MDYDDISMWVLSMIAPQAVKPLVLIFNLLLSTGIFPSEMKISKVIQAVPLFKNRNKSDFSIYRQISFLSQFSKILEKSIRRATTKILEYK